MATCFTLFGSASESARWREIVMKEHKWRLIIDLFNDSPMEEGQNILQTEKKALRELVKPEDKDWDMRFTAMSDYDRVFRRIMSIENWEEDRDLVYLFITMRNRKHNYFSEFYIEEDLVIVPNVLNANYQQPNTEGLSQQERKITLLVHSFICNIDRHQRLRAAYSYVYKQFSAINDWEKNSALVKLHEKIQEYEIYYKKQLSPEDLKEWSQVERGSLPRREKINEIDEEIQKASEQGIETEDDLKYYLRRLHDVQAWSKEAKLMQWHLILIGKLRVLLLKQQGIWDSRIVGLSKDSPQVRSEDVTTKKGFLSRAWEKLWPSKNPT